MGEVDQHDFNQKDLADRGLALPAHLRLDPDLEALRLRPECCPALDDSGAGLRAARAARLPTLVTVSDYTADDDFHGAAVVLDHLGEPELPVRVLAGDLGDATYVDVDALRTLHARQSRSCAGSRARDGRPRRSPGRSAADEPHAGS